MPCLAQKYVAEPEDLTLWENLKCKWMFNHDHGVNES